jgi:hypothetical protein
VQEAQLQAQQAAEAVAAIAQQRFAAAQAAIAQLSDTDVLVATPDTLLSYISVNQHYKEAPTQLRGSSSTAVTSDDSSSDDADSDSDSNSNPSPAAAVDLSRGLIFDFNRGSRQNGSNSGSDDDSTSIADSSNPGDLLRFDQLYWFVADEAGLREAVQQQIERLAATGDDELGDPVSLRETWCQQLSRIAGHLRSAEVDHGKYPTAGEVEMSETARMVYLAEVSHNCHVLSLGLQS